MELEQQNNAALNMISSNRMLDSGIRAGPELVNTSFKVTTSLPARPEVMWMRGAIAGLVLGRGECVLTSGATGSDAVRRRHRRP